LQKNIASEKGVVMDGRDITSVVLKDAELKIYLDADFEERVRRRYVEEVKKGKNSTLEDVRNIIKLRDDNDMNNNKTLVKSDDSIVVDTTKTTVEEAVEQVYKLAKERIGND
jgi:cytidylate kinase